MTKEELFFENETRKHQQEVVKIMIGFAQELMDRALSHDNSKFKDPERDVFIEYTPKLRETTYGSKEYKECTSQMKEAIQVHYSKNKHHPEFNASAAQGGYQGKDLVSSMNLLDIVEMLCDWLAATKRHADGDINKSLVLNEERFGLSNQLVSIFRNTFEEMKESE